MVTSLPASAAVVSDLELALIEVARSTSDAATDAGPDEGGVHTMGAAVRAADGRTFVGVNLYHFTIRVRSDLCVTSGICVGISPRRGRMGESAVGPRTRFIDAGWIEQSSARAMLDCWLVSIVRKAWSPPWCQARAGGEMRQKVSVALTALLLVGLLASLAIQVWILPAAVNSVVTTFPEVEPLSALAIIWGILAIACLQVAAVIGLRVVALARARSVASSSYGLLRAVLGCLAAFSVLVLAAFITLNVIGYATPGVVLGLIVVGVFAVIVAVSIFIFLGTRPAARVRPRS